MTNTQTDTQTDTQNLRNHARTDPLFNYVLGPILLLNLGFSVYVTVHHWPEHRALFAWWIVMSVALLVLAAIARTYSLKVQDRVIRLEERLRLSALLPPSDLPKVYTLTAKQLVALRFASDAELPSLVHRVLAEDLTPALIKQNIITWRADHLRV